MGFIKNVVRKNKWLFWLWIFFDVVIIALPQWLDSVWGLAEKTEGRPLTMSPLPSWTFGITVPIGLAMFGIAIWAVISRKTETVVSLIDTLTAMHRRLVELQKEKAKRTKIGFSQLKEVLPTLSDRIGIVKLKDWPKFENNVKRRIRAAMPQPNYKRPWSYVKQRERAHLAALSVASAVKRELFQSKEWTFEDGMKISDWLDGYHWGVKEPRDNDAQWDALFKSISHYLTDTKLSELIDRHIDFSCFYNNVCLIIRYSERFPKTSFFPMLHEELVGSPISPEKIEIALGELLDEIRKRLMEIAGSTNLGIEVTETMVKSTNGG